ncbi:MAG: penicillin-binding protein activator LpoB [Gemmatimonadetes bacterium]|uniref:Penicillin-binding protein activator LpoB n=1 Tax=Candidatus Kutchimonas denitrificans TaxID=3056748 RepID=A0AAE4Z5A5_9BACT|nr:penicillin-binding protein activator LpoB [Gemmatimonadota bacterium]NIR73793.1 penicillin-binding protein activator LpoB [Candidatus Kutchimonas denitrificans]NIS03157.1 penicillin-binding protein activator LpoB [Gemmatimonadota bacterium]NIT69058.1 penicillin-binding protein activator LpoB [Gemmatimonadota bacterium]NIU54149.1 penicillin-binding protein activator LpoB [Gemmatimonadota bacterium]
MQVNAHNAAVFLLVTFGLASLMACGKNVRRLDPESTTDLSGFWNDTDSRLVANDMIADCLTHPWIQNHALRADAKPVAIVGSIRNRSMEHIPTGTFIRDIERALVNSGQVSVVANPYEREELRDEREAQQDWAREETRSRLRAETGADYMLNGAIDVIIDKEGGTEVKFYQVDLYLTDIESNERVWIGQKKIKKEISRRGIGF